MYPTVYEELQEGLNLMSGNMWWDSFALQGVCQGLEHVYFSSISPAISDALDHVLYLPVTIICCILELVCLFYMEAS